MRVLKITFLLLAVLILTVSGQSSDVVVENNDEQPTYKTYKQYDLIAHARKRAKMQTQG